MHYFFSFSFQRGADPPSAQWISKWTGQLAVSLPYLFYAFSGLHFELSEVWLMSRWENVCLKCIKFENTLRTGFLGKEKWSEERAGENGCRLSDGHTEYCLPPHPDHVQVGKAHYIRLRVINMGLNLSPAILESRNGLKNTRVFFWHDLTWYGHFYVSLQRY